MEQMMEKSITTFYIEGEAELWKFHNEIPIIMVDSKRRKIIEKYYMVPLENADKIKTSVVSRGFWSFFFLECVARNISSTEN